MKIVVRSAMGLVALAAAALSYQSLAELGMLAGYGNLAWLYPLVVDAGAAASCAAWIHTKARQPLAMTWGLLAISVILNGTVHFLESTGTAPSWLLVVAVAAVPPTVLGLTVHLAVGMGEKPVPAQIPTASPESDSPALEQAPEGDWPGEKEGPAGPSFMVDESDHLHLAKRIVASSDVPVGRNRLARELDISPYRARTLLEQLNNNGSAS